MSDHTFRVYRFASPTLFETELPVEQETESTTQILRVASHMDMDVNSRHADNSTNDQIYCLENSTVISPWHFNTRLA